MLTLLVTALLATAAPANPVVEDLGDGRFRITVASRGLGAEQLLRATGRLLAEAHARCEGRGEPVEIGQGQAMLHPNERFELISVYTCRAPAPPRR